MDKQYTLTKQNLDITSIRLNQITLISITVSIPLLVHVFQERSSWAEKLFFFLLLVLSITISRQLDVIKQRIHSIENINKELIKLQQKVTNGTTIIKGLQTLIESNTNIKIDFVNRDKSSSKEGYKKLQEVMSKSERNIKILSSSKSRNFKDPHRSKFFKFLESFIKEKTKKDKGFIYKRLVPVSSKHVHDGIPHSLNEQTLSHCKRIAIQFPRSTTIGCRSIQRSSIPMSFIIVDSTYLIILLPKLSTKGSELRQGDECTLQIFIHDKKRTFIRSLERQYDLLYTNGTAIYDFYRTFDHEK